MKKKSQFIQCLKDISYLNKYFDPVKATSNQNARPWIIDDAWTSYFRGISILYRSDSDDVLKSIVYFTGIETIILASNVSTIGCLKYSSNAAPFKAVKSIP